MFEDFVKKQVYLSNADGDRESDDFDYKTATESLEEKFLGKINGYEVTENNRHIPFVTNPISFSRDLGPEPEENVEKNIFRKSFIRYDILSKVKRESGSYLQILIIYLSLSTKNVIEMMTYVVVMYRKQIQQGLHVLKVKMN